MDRPRAKRRLLTASIGVAAFTALEGLACGNPVAPRYERVPEPTPTAEPDVAPTATASAATSVSGSAAVAVDPPAQKP